MDLFRRIRIGGYGWTAIAIVCLFLGLSLALYLSIGNHRAPVGVLIGIMGFVAAAITFRDKPQKMEKAIWIILMTVLLVAEIRNLYIADAEQNAKLEKISGDLTTSVAGINTMVNNITGGDSITFLAAEIGPGPPFRLDVWVFGQYPVNNVAANMQQLFGTDPASGQRQVRSMHSVALGSDWFGPGITPTNESIQAGRYIARITARNGDITEQIDIAQCSDGSWSQAIKMNGAGAKENEKLKGRLGCNEPFD